MDEKRIALIHRVIVSDNKDPKEYAILVTDERSIFIRQKKTRSSLVLRGEVRWGTAVVTDVVPKTLEDYEQTPTESLVADSANVVIPHEAVKLLQLRKGVEMLMPFFRLGLAPLFSQRLREHKFHAYNFELKYRASADREDEIKFYMVPLGAYLKPRRLTQSRETIIREYAEDALKIYQSVLPASVIGKSP